MATKAIEFRTPRLDSVLFLCVLVLDEVFPVCGECVVTYEKEQKKLNVRKATSVWDDNLEPSPPSLGYDASQSELVARDEELAWVWNELVACKVELVACKVELVAEHQRV